MWSHAKFVTWFLCGLIYCGNSATHVYSDIANYCVRYSYHVCVIRNVTISGDSTIFTGNRNPFIYEVKFQDSTLETIPNIFRLLPNLKQFTAENCGIKFIIRDNLFEAGSVQVLDLIFNRIGSLPSGVFAEMHGIEDIRLGHNDIEQLLPDTFANTSSIVDLQLNANKIKILPKDLFAPLIMLEYIDLEYNRIELVDASTFRKNINLRTVLLNNNNIIKFDSNSFSHISQLYLIDVSFNSIKNITLNTVNTLRATKSNLTTCKLTGSAIRLKLSNNHLKAIDIKDFNETRDLDIHNNQFESLEAFKDGRSLQNVDISYNPIVFSDHLSFRQNKLLSELRLGGLNLPLSYEFFSDFEDLNLLDISENNITVLDIRTLRPLQHLEHLYMERNNIVEFDYSELKMYFPFLKEISIAGNPMNQSFIDKLLDYCESNGIFISVVHKSLTRIECTKRNSSLGNPGTNGPNDIGPLPTSTVVITTIAVVLALEIVGFICFKMWKRSRNGEFHFENPFWLRFERLTGDSQSVQS